MLDSFEMLWKEKIISKGGTEGFPYLYPLLASRSLQFLIQPRLHKTALGWFVTAKSSETIARATVDWHWYFTVCREALEATDVYRFSVASTYNMVLQLSGRGSAAFARGVEEICVQRVRSLS